MNVMMPKPGKYVAAVSGGVDSMALLQLLHEQLNLELTVAHFDHGIREDSFKDRKLVQKIAKQYSLPFVFEEGRLGKGTSEAEAREARYKFLQRAQNSAKARAIITAHHQDDVLETAVLNILRGTGRKGLTSLSSRSNIIRPLLDVSKNELIKYAQTQGLVWREDPSNQDTVYLRNYIRHKLLPKLNDQQRSELVSIVTNLTVTNRQLDQALIKQLQSQSGTLGRRWFNQLPHAVAREVMAAWLRSRQIRGFDRPALERLVVAAKTAQAGKRFSVLNGCTMEVGKDVLALGALER
jgi:tRNA(Ile)-lysidine synthetase-like protein